MTTEPFVPDAFDPPRGLSDPRFMLEPLGPQHNERDYAAWTSSIEHIRTTPGFVDRTGFTYTVLDPADRDVIGCIYIYPRKDGSGPGVRSWVRADRADLDEPLADAVAGWLRTAWPFAHVSYLGRPDLSR